MRKIRLLELFAGSGSMSNEARKMGFEVFSVDIKDFPGIDMAKDVEFLEREDIPWVPDIIHASPPCTTYSLAAISHHRNMDRSPKTPFGFKSDRLVKKTLEIISWFPDAVFYIENPRATLRKMEFMQGIPLTTVTYCSYGDIRMKPTDIWSNNLDRWKPRPMCKNGNRACHHEAAPRGAKTGTQGLKGSFDRSKIPAELCREILFAAVKFEVVRAEERISSFKQSLQQP